jgi:hypothetical protein
MTLEEAIAALKVAQESIAKLEAKNTELIGEKKAKAGELGGLAERLAALEAKRAEEAARAAGDFEKAQTLRDQAHAGELAKARAELEAERAAAQKLLVGVGLKDAIANAGVLPHFAPAVEAMLAMQGAKVELKDGAHVATLGGKPIAEAVAEWARGDAGKHFIGSGNAGGGAGGSGAKGDPSGVALEKNPYADGKPGFSLTAQGRIEKDNPALAARLKAEARAS